MFFIILTAITVLQGTSDFRLDTTNININTSDFRLETTHININKCTFVVEC